MKNQHFCDYLSHRFRLENATFDNLGEIIEGELVSKSGDTRVAVRDGIPRFISDRNYAENFGLQWNIFRSTQLDSSSGLPLTAKRFWTSTKWNAAELAGKKVLEPGSGAGRFTEVLLQAGANVVSFDYSHAVDANRRNNSAKGDLFLFQGDIYDIPFPDNYFDYVFCYGVLQHTPDPIKAYHSIFRKLRSKGRLSIDYYRFRWTPTPWSTPKYIWRPITRRMDPKKLLKLIQFYIPLYLPIDTFLRNTPLVGKLIVALIPIPCWNYLGIGLTKQQRSEWAVMDTFDALGAAYDYPKTLPEVRQMIDSAENEQADIFYGSNGIVANILKR